MFEGEGQGGAVLEPPQVDDLDAAHVRAARLEGGMFMRISGRLARPGERDCDLRSLRGLSEGDENLDWD